MATDVDLLHTIDDDITFERVRHMPRRTKFVSTHRKLSWQYDKELKQFERDHRLVSVEISRAKSAMTEKLNRLQDTKQQISIKKSNKIKDSRRNSAPSLTFETGLHQIEATGKQVAVVNSTHHSKSQSSVLEAASVYGDTSGSRANGLVLRKAMTELVVSHPKSHAQMGKRRATIAEGIAQSSHPPLSILRRLTDFMGAPGVKDTSIQNKSKSKGGNKKK